MPPHDFNELLRSIREAAIPIASLDEDEVRDRIFQADLIWGYDAQRDVMPLFYGRELLADISRGRDAEFGFLMLLCFRLDLQSDDPERLAQAIQQLRGNCCFRRFD